jgi:hypothetical protein
LKQNKEIHKMKLISTVFMCSLLVASQAFAQSVARAAKGAKEPGRITAPKAGGKLSEGQVGSTGSVARPNMGATSATQKVGTIGTNDIGGSCGGDLSSAEKAIIAEARAAGYTSPKGGCLDKLTGEPKKVAVNAVLAGGLQAMRRLGVNNFALADNAQKAIVYDGSGELVGASLKTTQADGLERVEQLCNNDCNVTACDAKAFAAAKTN